MNDLMNFKYRAGDILVSCDNDLAVPKGYLGHSAIAVDEHNMVEAVIDFPFIQLAPISRFVNKPGRIPAVYRPVDAKLGERAAAFVRWYYEMSEKHRMQGIICPPFSFNPAIPLWDLWTTVYCSKLIWLAYYYGAGMALPNDYFLFTPEDIDSNLSRANEFEVAYKHPEFEFLIDT